MAQRREGRDSRCCKPSLAPLSWRDYVDPSHPSVVGLEDWLATLVPFARIHEEGENEELMEAAARGELWYSGDAKTPIDAIHHDPEIYELRRTALKKMLRFYHAEPVERPADLIALHRHIKEDKPTQQVEIEHAADRYRSGRATGWT